MKDLTKNQWFLALVAILLFLFIWFACIEGGILDDLIGDDDTDDDEEEEEEQEEEEEEQDICTTVKYTKKTWLNGYEWKAISVGGVGLPNTFINATSQITGGYKWTAYWDDEANMLGRISPSFSTKFLLDTYLDSAYASGEMSFYQHEWYRCMITTGYGGIIIS